MLRLSASMQRKWFATVPSISILPNIQRRFQSTSSSYAEQEPHTTTNNNDNNNNNKAETDKNENGEKDNNNKDKSKSTALGAAQEPEGGKRRNITVLSNTTKAVYIHPINHIASWYWFVTDFHKYFLGIIILFIGSQILARYRLAQKNTVTQAQLGENLIDQRTRDLLNDIETLRRKDPLRLESEANYYHAAFGSGGHKQKSEERRRQRNLEVERGTLQGEARGTDLTEWMDAKEKEDEEREVARRTQEYIQGFHQHLKSKRLI